MSEQSLSALERANEIRTTRAQLKRDLKAGRTTAGSYLREPVARDLETMRVWDLIISVPRMGRYRTTKILNHCNLLLSKTLGGLTDNQRRRLLEELGGK